MEVTRTVLRMPGILVFLVVVILIGLSTWALHTKIVQATGPALDQLIADYDDFVPRVTIAGGKAGVEVEQPYIIKPDPKGGPLIVIDTREGKQKEALKLLEDQKEGMVLTRDSLVIKQPHKVQTIPLKDLPDFVLDSRSIASLRDEYFGWVVVVSVLILFIVQKPFQILLFALLPFFASRLLSAPISYGNGFKLAVFALIPPDLLTLVFAHGSISFKFGMLLYFGLYAALLILGAFELSKSPPPSRIVTDRPLNP
ncbi:DUF1189 family protein [Thermodesulfobacteriota bacterium]